MKMTKFSTKVFSILGVFFFLSQSGVTLAEEDWKGTPPKSEFGVSPMLGFGNLDGNLGFSVIGALSKKIIPQGFVPEINNQVFVEFLAGPLFLTTSVAVVYGVHLRWDFYKTPAWALFTTGGIGGAVFQAGAAASTWRLHPRFAMGTFFRLNDLVNLRAELSHELVLVGVNFNF